MSIHYPFFVVLLVCLGRLGDVWRVEGMARVPFINEKQARTLMLEQAHTLLETRGVSFRNTVANGGNDGDDIDFEHEVVYVQRSMSWVKGYGYREGEPKTKTSRRKIVLSGVILDSLRMHREQQEQVRLKIGEKWHEQYIVFCNLHGGFLNPASVVTLFQKTLKKAGLPRIRFHDLRHSSATILLAAKVHPKVVQERLGHSTIAMTMDIYSHVLPSMQQETAEIIEEMFKGF